MDTEAPISVLDRRTRSTTRENVITDRLTRQRSPGPGQGRHQHKGRVRRGLRGSDDDEDGDGTDVIYRISQPYRTSFSAKHSVTWGKADRSRSLSPTSSLQSDLSYRSMPPCIGGGGGGRCWGTSSLSSGGRTRRPRGRSKSPKRVTYDTRVTVRHSDDANDDSMLYTELSRNGLDDDSPMRAISATPSPFSRSVISPRYNEFSHPPAHLQKPAGPRYYRDPGSGGSSGSSSSSKRPTAVRDVTNLKLQKSRSLNNDDDDQSVMSRDSGLDFSSSSAAEMEIKDLSNQITAMEWSPRQNRALRKAGRPYQAQKAPSDNQCQTQQHQPSSHSSNQHSQGGRSHPSLRYSQPQQQYHQHQPQQQQQQQQHYQQQQQQQVNRRSPPAGSQHGILKDSRNSRGSRDLVTGTIASGHGALNDGPVIGHRNSGSRSSSTRASPVPPSTPTPTPLADKENDPTQSPTRSPGSSGLDLDLAAVAHDPAGDVISRDYEHRRVFSYQDAVDGKYGDEVQRLAEKGVQEAQVQTHYQQQQQQQQQQALQSPTSPVSDTDERGKNGGLNHVKGKPPAGRSPPDETCVAMPKDTSTGDSSPGRGSPTESGRLTPSKRSFSLSITNFLKRFSPHLRRKRSRDRGSKSSSAGGSAQSLPTSDNNSDPESPTGTAKDSKHRGKGHFSRSRVRSSLMKLVGKSKSKKGGKTKSTDHIPTPSHYTIELQDPDKTLSSDEVDEIISDLILNANDANTSTNANGKPAFTANTTRIMKSIQQNKAQEADIYRRFKDRHSPRGSDKPDAANVMGSAISPTDSGSPTSDTYGLSPSGGMDNSSTDWTSSKDISMEFFTETDIRAILNPKEQSQSTAMGNSSAMRGAPPTEMFRASPPSSLDVISPKNIRILQTSMMSSISGDDSIGECSLDVNLTASEPSLLGGPNTSQSGGGSRQVAIPSSLVNSTVSSSDVTGNTGNNNSSAATAEGVKLRKHHARVSNKENSLPLSSESGSSGPSSPTNPSHIPSYLKLSCAVSGYGKYSRYSTYKDVNKPSPYSSQNSLRSACTSPEPNMPAERSGDEQSPEHMTTSRLSPAGWVQGSHNAQPTVNGHAPKYPTGDITKDGEYFLQHTHFEEDRIRGLSSRAEALMRSQNLPEEACGRIRSAIGKANLLLSQKFAQFRDLCYSHMQPDPEERETKWEDLQGFWDMVKIQIDNVDDMFAEIEIMKGNGWQEIPKMPSRRSSASSSPKSGNVSQTSTPSATPGHTPGSRRKNLKPSSNKDTPESSPERTQKARQAAKARDEARRKLLAERRAAMKQQQTASASTNGASSNSEVEIYLPDPPKK